MFRIFDAHVGDPPPTCEARHVDHAPAPPGDPERFAVLDDPVVARRFAHPGADGMEIATFVVPAVHCASCVWLLERLYQLDVGVGRSEVDLVRRTVRIAFSPGRVTLRRIAERLAGLGYDPLLDPERLPAAMPVSRRTLYVKIGVAGFAFGNVMLFSIPRYVNGGPLDPEFQRLFNVLNLLFALPVLLYSASDYFVSAWRAIRVRTMRLDVPVALGLLALFGRSVADIAAGRGEGFLDSFSGLVFFLLIGRLFQQKAFDGIAFDRTIRSFLPLSVRVECGLSAQVTPLDLLQPGDVISVRPEEVVPADSMLLDADGAVDYAFVSGESDPQRLRRGDLVSAGGRVVTRAVRLSVIRPVSQSRLAELWNHPVFARPKSQWMTTVSARFGAWFIVAAILLAVAGAVAWRSDPHRALEVATAVLIIACPCALTLAAPITLGVAMGHLGRCGCYLKQPEVVLDLSGVDTVAFDKTGTLTTAGAEAHLMCDGFVAATWQRIRRLAAESVHPISRAIAGRGHVIGEVSGVEVSAGEGVSGVVDGERVAIGTAAFVARTTGQRLDVRSDRTWAAAGHRPAGWIRVLPSARTGIVEALSRLRARYRLWLLSGDSPHNRSTWDPFFGRSMRYRLTPEAKLSLVRDLQARGSRVLMVGDGLNDAGALAGADVGLAVSDETACLVPACDGLIRGDRLRDLPAMLDYARRARHVIWLCFAVSVLYNAAGLTFALSGRLTPLASAVLMPVSSLTIIALATGLMRGGPRRVSR